MKIHSFLLNLLLYVIIFLSLVIKKLLIWDIKKDNVLPTPMCWQDWRKLGQKRSRLGGQKQNYATKQRRWRKWRPIRKHKKQETKLPVGRAVRAAMIEVSQYLDCVLYLKDECVAEYKAKDEKRKESTKGTLDMF